MKNLGSVSLAHCENVSFYDAIFFFAKDKGANEQAVRNGSQEAIFQPRTNLLQCILSI